jgi:two-component system NtrC family response regulator
VLQERKFRPLGSNHEISSDFRLITATHRNLSQMVAKGDFRQDLFYRLRSFVIELPALRNRSRDIEELANYYMRQTCREHGFKRKAFSSEFREILEQYHWPGNVRELMNAVNTAVLAAQHDPTLYAKHLPQEPRLHRTLARLEENRPPLKEPVQDASQMISFREYRSEAVKRAERHYLSRLMAEAKGNISKALQISGLGRSRLYALLKEHGLAKTSS